MDTAVSPVRQQLGERAVDRVAVVFYNCLVSWQKPHFTHIPDGQWMVTKDVLSGFNDPLQRLPVLDCAGHAVSSQNVSVALL